MELIRSRAWYETRTGEPRGYIKPHEIRELWFHTGTACNLSCDFCLEGSGPGDKRLELVKFDDVKPFIDESLTLGVEQFSFTGGEPFLAKQLIEILAYAAQFKPCLVLTNGTDALQSRIKQVAGLVDTKFPISFRISIDSSDEEIHDKGRGKGNFHLAMLGAQKLHALGFHVSIARHMAEGENKGDVDAEYQALFRRYQLPEDLTIVAFPDFMTPDSHPDVPDVSEHCMTTYQTEQDRRNFMCAFSKMIVKKQGAMRVYACTLVDDDSEYDLGETIKASLESKISMKHHRCFSCFKFGASCSEL